MVRAVNESRAATDSLDAPRLTPDRIRRGIARRIRNRSTQVRDFIFMPVASAGEWLASLYYATFSREFFREHVAVARGRSRYRKESSEANRHFYKLRRNVHRLEKGLVMRPRRATFAADYIGETVTCYSRLVELAARAPESVDERELRWSRDVLKEYFAVVGHGRDIDRARTAFTATPEPSLTSGDTLYVPHQRDLSEPPTVSYDDLLALSQRRRSVRWYLPTPVPHEVIDRALEVAVQSPSACNRQPFEFRIVDDPELVARVSRLPGGTGGFGHNLPALAVIVGKLRAFAKERDRHLIYIDGGLAAMAFMYAIESQGLASCSINWPDSAAEDREMRRVLSLAPDERVVMLIAFGYPDPDGMVPFSAKTPLDVLRRFN